MGSDNATLGKASLWTSIIGIVLPVSLAVLVAVFLKPPNEQQRLEYERLREWANLLCAVLFVILELVALGCGIAARRTATGKIGLIVAVVVLLLFSFAILLKTLPKRKPAPAAPANEVQADPEPPRPVVPQEADKGKQRQGDK
jgi:hypothetical protein